MHARPGRFPGFRPVAMTATADCPVVLHRGGQNYIITSCDRVLMASHDTASERALGILAARRLRGRRRPRVLVGGLGMGYTLRRLLDGLRGSADVVVAELLRPVVRWNRQRIGHLARHPLRDPRVRVYLGDVANLMRDEGTWDSILMDIDNGPEWIVQRRNQALYGRDGLARILASLRPGGFLALWSVARYPRFERDAAALGFRARRFLRAGRADDSEAPLIYLVNREGPPPVSTG